MQGGHLASITSKDENNFIRAEMEHIYASVAWIGLSALQSTGYMWNDGTPVNFLNWAENEPNNWEGQESCANMDARNG